MWPGGHTMPRSALKNSGVFTQQNPSSYNQIPLSLVTYVSHVLISYFQAACPPPNLQPLSLKPSQCAKVQRTFQLFRIPNGLCSELSTLNYLQYH